FAAKIPVHINGGEGVLGGRCASLEDGLEQLDHDDPLLERRVFAVDTVALDLLVGDHGGLALLGVDQGDPIGTGVAGIQTADNERRIGDGIATQHVAQGGPVGVGGGAAAPA